MALAEQLNELVRVMTSIRTEGDKLRARDGAARRCAHAPGGLLQEEKRQSLAERQAELAQVRKAAAEITKNVADLGDLIAKLDKEVAGKAPGLAPTRRRLQPPRQRRRTALSRRPAQSRRRRSTASLSPTVPTEDPARPSCSRRAATASPC